MKVRVIAEDNLKGCKIINFQTRPEHTMMTTTEDNDKNTMTKVQQIKKYDENMMRKMQ